MDDIELMEGLSASQPITIPYIPRKHFLGFHRSAKRHRFMVVHRRGGKTVAIGNDLIKDALTIGREYPPVRCGYVGPSFSQAKDTIWGYLKHYTKPIPGIKINESDLQMVLPNGAVIALYPGADAYERMRGIYFDRVALDEFALLNPDAWDSVVRPCLADYRGRAIIAGTSNGDDHFHAMKQMAEASDDWDSFDIKASQTDAIHPDELAEMKRDMEPFKYAREMENSFSAPIEGAYYGELMADADEQGRICKVPYDPRVPVVTSWDLGIRDTMSVWFFQRVSKELRAINYMQAQGKGLDWWAKELHKTGYNFSEALVPHDVQVRELSTGRTRYEVMMQLQLNPLLIPSHGVPDRINAVRTIIPTCYFDGEKCEKGISAMKSYKQGRNGKPLHDWASHGADSFGHGAVGSDHATWGGMFNMVKGALRRKIKGLV